MGTIVGVIISVLALGFFAAVFFFAEKYSKPAAPKTDATQTVPAADAPQTAAAEQVPNVAENPAIAEVSAVQSQQAAMNQQVVTPMPIQGTVTATALQEYAPAVKAEPQAAAKNSDAAVWSAQQSGKTRPDGASRRRYFIQNRIKEYYERNYRTSVQTVSAEQKMIDEWNDY